jgi:hypothetical protein
LFKAHGSILGSVVLSAIMTVVVALDYLISGIETAINRLSYFSAWKKGNKREMSRLDMEAKQIQEDYKKRTKETGEMIAKSWKGTGKSIKGIFSGTEKGSVEKTVSNQSAQTNIDNKKVTINVNGAQDPKAIVQDIEKVMKANIMESKYRSGGR